METATIDPLTEESGTEPKPDDTTSPDNPGTDPNKPDDDSDIMDFIDSIADKIGVAMEKLLIIVCGSLAVLVLLFIVIVSLKRKRR